jgi:hypothetical protein
MYERDNYKPIENEVMFHKQLMCSQVEIIIFKDSINEWNYAKIMFVYTDIIRSNGDTDRCGISWSQSINCGRVKLCYSNEGVYKCIWYLTSL